MDAHAILCDQHDTVAGITFTGAAACKLDVNERVARFNADGDNAALADVGEFIERRFLHGALLRRKEQFAGLQPRHILLVRVGF